MKTNHFILTATLSVLCAGCVGSGPNTQQGAVGGAVAGAVAGAVIGNNSRSHDSVTGALVGGAVGGVAGAAIGNNLDHQRGTIYTSEQDATTNVVVREAPPPPPVRMEARRDRDAHDAGAIWVEGHWIYGGDNRYAWQEGHWMVPPQRYRTYVAPHWKRHGGGYVYVQGYWR